MPVHRWLPGSKGSTAPLVAWILLTLIVVLPALLLQVYDLTFWWSMETAVACKGVIGWAQ
ncbi:MAG: hypothetical protein R3E31_00790 [Chloroflexota bacterium]